MIGQLTINVHSAEPASVLVLAYLLVENEFHRQLHRDSDPGTSHQTQAYIMDFYFARDTPCFQLKQFMSGVDCIRLVSKHI
jgi:hypothetical protein